MQPGPDGGGRTNLFSLVAYIPDPLGSFLDRLRTELVPSCRLKAHVTVLPPRPIFDNVDAALDQLRSGLRDFSPFEVRATQVEMFSLTSVVYLCVGAGFAKLRRLHEVLNTGPLQFCEPYPYHPHITLAQQMAPEQVEGVFELARLRWAQCPFERSFTVESLAFVQGTCTGDWIDLVECPVGSVAAVPQNR